MPEGYFARRLLARRLLRPKANSYLPYTYRILFFHFFPPLSCRFFTFLPPSFLIFHFKPVFGRFSAILAPKTLFSDQKYYFNFSYHFSEFVSVFPISRTLFANFPFFDRKMALFGHFLGPKMLFGPENIFLTFLTFFLSSCPIFPFLRPFLVIFLFLTYFYPFLAQKRPKKYFLAPKIFFYFFSYFL